MIFGFFVLFVALAISAVAAYYSIMGLTAIFAASFVPIVIMGVALEVGKITATVWLHNYWDRASTQFKLYLVPAIVILMIITSMGIFGFLSKAHLDQAVPAGDIMAKVAMFDDRIATERENIAADKKALQQMDLQVNETLGRTTDIKGTNRAVQIRKQQAKERSQLQSNIIQAQKNIGLIQAERAPIASEVRKVEAEVGPIKYIAALIYGDNPDANLLERAVRWVIILLVLVFDPLALILILAADQTFIWAREKKPAVITEPTTDEDDEIPERIFETPEEFFESGKNLARKLDEDVAVRQTYLDKPWTWIPVPPYGTPKEEPAPAQEETASTAEFDPPPFNTVYRPQPAMQSDNSAPVGFGISFPPSPTFGEMFIRVDLIPFVLYKWNGSGWIEVNKNLTDRYAYNEAYIQYLVSKLQSGEYDPEFLTVAEEQQIKEYLNGTN